MRRKLVVVVAAFIAAAAFASVPAPAVSRPASPERQADDSAFRRVVLGDGVEAPASEPGAMGPAFRSDGFLEVGAAFTDPGVSPDLPVSRPRVNQPEQTIQSAWKPPRYAISGYATFYDNGTTAMRLPRGTVVRICGAGGCIERVVNDYGPANVKGRIVDLYRPDFFAICGCASWSGTTWVTVSVY